MTQLTLTAEILAAALQGFEAQRNRLDAQIAEIRRMLNGDVQRAASNGDLKPKRTVSAAARRKMARAQRLRWKKIKQATEPEPVAKPRRKRSTAVRKRMAEAQKKRWAAIKTASVSKTGAAKKSSAKTFA